MTAAPAPYYEAPNVRLYWGDCREILPLVAPPSARVLLLVDRPYGASHTEKINRASRSARRKVGARGHGHSAANRVWAPIEGDARPADASDFAAYTRRLEWGWNHFSATLPPSPSIIVWDKRAGSEPDDGADCEIAWTNLGGPARVFRHLWRGTCRASETGTPHLHPTQKPVAFYRWLFAGRGRGKPVVQRGDLIVVPFAGSGPEIPAAIEIGLDVVAIDVEREYLNTIIEHRIKPALERGKQVDLWSHVRREEQRPLFEEKTA